jgi:hypothetical protein
MARLPAPRRFDVYEYHQMADAGILKECDRVELIEGEIVERSPDRQSARGLCRSAQSPVYHTSRRSCDRARTEPRPFEPVP